MGEVRNTTFSSVNLNGRDHSGRRRYRWEDNIRMDHREIGCEGRDWMHVAQDTDQWRALVNIVNEPLGSIKDDKFID
jgi:hypothetical protein